MGDSYMCLLPQGFYVRTKAGVIHAAQTVPGEHVIGSKWRILTSDFGYCDRRGGWHWALRGMPYDGESSCFRDSFRIAPATLHDHGCEVAMAMEPGKARNEARADNDALYAEMLDFVGCFPATVLTFGAGVRAWSQARRWAKAEPSYITDLVRAYVTRGIERCLPMVWSWQAAA